MLLKAATLVELEPVCLETGDLRIANGRIVARGPSLVPEPDDEVFDLSGRLVLPGLVSTHHRLHGIGLRGLKREDRGYAGTLAALNEFEARLSLDDAQVLAAASGLEGLLSGTTTIFNRHASAQVTGALNCVAHGLNGVGLRAVLACEVTDRFGESTRDEALAECSNYADRARGRFRAAFAFGSLSHVTDDTLRAISRARLACPTPGLLFGTLADDAHEEKTSRAHFGQGPIERLEQVGLLGESTVLSHNVHLSWPQLSHLLSFGPWMVHTPRANMASQTGLATPAKFGVRTCIGTDVMSLDVLAEVQTAALRGLEVGQPLNVLRLLANGHRLASEAFGASIGPLREGSIADLMVSDYQPASPLDESTLGDHLLFGMSSRDVESVMVDGLWRLWKRKPLAIEAKEVSRSARDRVAALWAQLGAEQPLLEALIDAEPELPQ